MRDARTLVRVLTAIPELGLRVDFLASEFWALPVVELATLLDQLCEQNERSEPRAREAMLAVAAMFAGLGESPLGDRLREEAAGRRLLSLDRLLRRGAPTLSERAPQLPVPDYGRGRELTLGERKSLARRPDRRSFEKLMSDPHPLVIRQLLENPRLTENDVVRLAAGRPARIEVLQQIARMPRWLSRSRVRMTLLLNPGSPPAIAQPLLSVCTRCELRQVLESADAPGVLRMTALELIERRPPLRDAADALLQ
jgi:hypothetical protein